MNQFKKSRLIVAVSTLVLLSVSLLFLSTYSEVGSPILFLNNGVKNSVSFLYGLVDGPVQFLSEKKESIEQLMNVYKENKQLKSTIKQMEDAVNEREALKAENASLREQLDIKEAYVGKIVISALVSVRVPITWTDQLVIDVGKNGGITENMLVVANGGLIGTVEEIQENSAVVKLLSHSDEFTKLPVKIGSGDSVIYGILSGYDRDSNSFLVTQLNSTATIEVGSSVVTSDLSGATPSNLQIGTVSSVKTSTGNLDKTLYVKPAADFSSIYSVMVIGE